MAIRILTNTGYLNQRLSQPACLQACVLVRANTLNHYASYVCLIKIRLTYVLLRVSNVVSAYAVSRYRGGQVNVVSQMKCCSTLLVDQIFNARLNCLVQSL